MALLTSETQAETSLGRRPAQAGGFLPSLFAWRTVYSFGWLEGLVLAGFCALTFLTIPWHESSIDEAQAWLISSQSSAWQIVRYRLHYEGAPALWDLILHVYSIFHGPYAGIQYIGAILAAAGVFVLLRWSPFPLLVRLLLPFTFFFAYQYAVVARPYTMFALFAFGLCALYPRKDKVVWFALTAGCLANLGFQGVVVDAAIVGLYLWERFQRIRHDDPDTNWLRAARSAVVTLPRWKTAAAVFAVLFGLSVYTALPAPDVNFAVGGQATSGVVHSLHEFLIGESPAITPDPPVPFAVPIEPERPHPSLHHPAQWIAWHVNHRVNGQQTAFGAVLEFFTGLASQMAWPIAVSNALACLFVALLVVWSYRRGALRALVPWVALIIFGQLVWVADHHAGMILIALLCGIWLAATMPGVRGVPLVLDRTFVMALSGILALQVGWTVAAVRHDVYGPYDPGLETANFLKEQMRNDPGLRVAGFGFYTVSIQPYFKQQPFFNQHRRFWLWSANDNPELQLRTTLATQPDIVVYGREQNGPAQMRNQWAPISNIPDQAYSLAMAYEGIPLLIRQAGYRETHRFCGKRFSRMDYSYRGCDVIFERDPSRPFVSPLPTSGLDE